MQNKIKLMTQKNEFSSFFFNIGVLIILLIIFFLIFLNTQYPFLWFDEAATFWISQGIKVDALPFTQSGTIKDVIYYNRNLNLDPGGFSLLLHFWSKIDTSHTFLRILPFTFFVTSQFLFIKIINKRLKNYFIATFFSLSFFLVSNYYSAAFELRAYSMELLLVLLCIYFVDKVNVETNNIFILIFSTSISLLMTGRYSSIIIVFITIAILVYKIFSTKSCNKNYAIKTTILILPSIISSFFVYYQSYIYQNKFSEKLHYLKYLNSDLKYLLEFNNIIFIILLILISFIYIKYKKNDFILLFAITINICFIFLSLIGKYPWDPTSTRCNVITLPVLVSIISISAPKIIPYYENNWIKKTTILSLAIILFSYANKLTPKYDKPADIYSFLTNYNFVNKPKIFMDRWSNVSVRYLYEYGNLKEFKKKHSYPSNFKLMSSPKYLNTINKTVAWYQSEKNMNEILNYDIIIGPEIAHYTSKKTQNKWMLIDSQLSVFKKK